MGVVLEPPSPDRFDDWLENSISSYAKSNIRSGRWHPEEAPKRAREACNSLLKEGLHTPDHYIWNIVLGGEDLGHVWLWINQSSQPVKAFIYDIHLHEANRGRGFGRQAMIALEKEAIKLGAEAIGLHVFAYNVRAHALYQKLGYQHVSHVMEKSLIDHGGGIGV